MRKIFVDKNEPVAAVVERMLAETDADIILVIPRNARIAETLANFHLLNREADGTGKRLTIESVDEEVLALAKAAKIPASHPLFSAAHSRSLSDIVPAVETEEESRPARQKGGAKSKKSPPARASKKFTFKPETPEEEEMVAEADFAAPEAGYVLPKAGEVEEREKRPMRRRFSRRGLAISVLVVVLFALGVWAVGAFFGRAEVKINFAEVPWEGKTEVLATKAVAEVNPNGKVVPAEVFRDKRNTTQFFPATGKAEVSEKAKARLTIWNAYSSQPQTLVATTRFETPDGKIYRLDNQVIIPGAEIKDGKIVPKSIETGVTADKAGGDWNIGPVEKLTIPGFKGTPRYEGFYGALREGASGGFVGEKAVPTDADIAAGKDKMTAILRSSLENNLLAGRSAEFKILTGASETEVTKMTVNRTTDDKGNFGIIGEAEFRAIGFREADLRTVLLDIARREYPDTDFRNLEIGYADVRLAYDKGEVRFSVEARGELIPAFSADDFRAQVAGEDLNSARSQILKLPRLKDAGVSVWPFWLRRLPEDPGRITLTLE